MKFIKRVTASSMKSHAVTTNSVSSDGHIPWRERLDLDEIEAETDDEGFDDLLMSIEEGGGSSGAVVSARRVPMSTGNLRRHDAAAKTAASSNWDDEFAKAQSHARDLISKLSG